MRPKPRSRMPLITGRVMLNSESRLVRITSDHCSWRHLLQHGVARDAGIVDQHLDRADLVLDIDDALLAGDVVAHVPFEDRDLGFLLEGLGGIVIAAIIGGDVIAGLLQSLGRSRRRCRAFPP